MRTKQRAPVSTDISQDSIAQLKEWLTDRKKVVILTHKNPDGDAIGSALGLRHVLGLLGHEAMVGIPDISPDFLKWMPGHQEVVVYDRKPDKLKEYISDADVVFFVDLNAPDRMGDLQDTLPLIRGSQIMIDHHPGQEPFADVSIVNSHMSSTSELLYHLFCQLGWDQYLERKSATCLMTGIITDTLGFRVNCSYPMVFQAAAHLVQCGADKDRIFDNVYNQYSENRMKLLGYCLDQKMVILAGKKAAYISLTKEEMKRFHHLKGDTEGFVNYPLSIKNVMFSVLFTEQNDHIKLSLRSKGTFPANEIAEMYFHGGGHLNAAGGRSFMSMEETIARFEEVVRLYEEQLGK